MAPSMKCGSSAALLRAGVLAGAMAIASGVRQRLPEDSGHSALAPGAAGFKVCVVGGAGGIGQPLSLLMAMRPDVAELTIYDLTLAAVPPEGVAADLSHINSKAKVRGYAFDVKDKPIEVAGEALTGCDLALVTAGLPRKPGQDRKDLLNVNAGIAKNIVEAIAKFAPEAVVALIVNPVNSIVPAMSALWKKKGLNPNKILGVTTLDVLRASKFVHEATGAAVEDIDIPVIGGHAGATILPLFSQDRAGATIPTEEVPELDRQVQDAGTVVVKAKNGRGSATLSMAAAAARLADAVLRGLRGEAASEYAYVESSVSKLPYFSSKVTFGPSGVEAVHPIGDLSPHEAARLDGLLPALQEDIDAGLEFAAGTEFAA